ncbi:MAG: hypothetical protein ABUJ98_10135 [Hyphomicrobium sp.]
MKRAIDPPPDVPSVNARGGPVSAARLGTASAEGADEQLAIATRARRLPSPRPFIVI